MSKGLWLNKRGMTSNRECCRRTHFQVLHRTSAVVMLLFMAAGCVTRTQFITAEARTPIDRKSIEYPRGYVLQLVASGLTAPSAIAIVNEDGENKGAILVAESGIDGRAPTITGYRPDGTTFSIYPRSRQIPTLGLLPRPYDIYGPIGGMVVTQGRIFVTHRDRRGRGVVSAFKFDGSCETVIGDLPAMGDFGVTDIAVNPITNRLYFGIGAATNSGVVGLDNWRWVQSNPDFCDLPYRDLKLLGFKYFTKNPRAGLFGGDDNVETAPFQPFGQNKALRIRAAANGKPTGAIYSISPAGGDAQVEATGLRYPRGLAFDTGENLRYAQLYATNNGMELRGSRPVKNDPDVLYKIDQWWYGWPDFSSDLHPISDATYDPGPEIMSRTSYPELSALIDRSSAAKVPNSNLSDPTTYRDQLVASVFETLSGAAKFAFVPWNAGFRGMEGRAIVALAGDRAPFGTGGLKLAKVPGRKIVMVNIETKAAPEDFIRNTEGLPASKLKTGGIALERPVDIKFTADGKMYILDFGQMEMRGSREKITPGTGKIFVLLPAPPATN